MATSTTELSRIPRQARSREKFDAILKKTLQLIHEKGYESVSVREIAREVGLPIASVYQYFPNKLAIVRQLFEGYTTSLTELLREELLILADEPSESSLNRVINSIVDHMVEHLREHPEFLDVWRCVDGSPELRALNRKDTIAVAETIKNAVLQMNPGADEDALMCRALIVCETANATVKLAQELPASRRKGIHDNLKAILISVFAEFV